MHADKTDVITDVTSELTNGNSEPAAMLSNGVVNGHCNGADLGVDDDVMADQPTTFLNGVVDENAEEPPSSLHAEPSIAVV